MNEDRNVPEIVKTFYSYVFDGEHHIPNKIKRFGEGYAVRSYGDLATYDRDTLTKIVIASHDLAIRCSVINREGGLYICAWVRKPWDGITNMSVSEVHPSLDIAVKNKRLGFKYWDEMEGRKTIYTVEEDA